METISEKLRVFDAFPKVKKKDSTRSKRGGVSTILSLLFCVLIIWIEFGNYFGGYVDHQFDVAKNIDTNIFLHMNIVVAMPCSRLSTNVLDITQDRYLAGEKLNFEGTFFTYPNTYETNMENYRHNFLELDDAVRDSLKAKFKHEGERSKNDFPACNIYGSIPINKVYGEFHIISDSFGIDLGFPSWLFLQKQRINFSHVIHEFSIGEFYPIFKNPLDSTVKITNKNEFAYRYYMKVVPTLYEKLGIVVNTFQYSLLENHRVVNVNNTNIEIPGIFFKYSFEPIRLSTIEKRLPFFQFLGKLLTIMSGLIFFFGYLYRFYEWVLILIFGKKYVLKDTDKNEYNLLPNNLSEMDLETID